MKITVMGMGYVGVVTVACLAREGHDVVGVDVAKNKVDIINSGKSPIIEPDMDELIREGLEAGRLSATTDPADAAATSELIFVCVGTPARGNGRIELANIRQVCSEIGALLKGAEGYPSIVLRSTVFPGTMEGIVIPTLEEYSGKKAGRDFGVCFNPEFMREGSSVYDFYNPPKTVVGELDPKTADRLIEVFSAFTDAPTIRAGLRAAEMVKYVDNIFHALKISFANEVGRACKKVEVDSHVVMDIFCRDTKLNISSRYLKPGYAFGGSCLPKDLNAFLYESKLLDLELPLIESLMATNNKQIEAALDLIKNTGKKKIGIFGLSFKEGTDDLRESPMVKLVEHLIGKGYNVRIYDRNVSIAKLFGSNRDYILNEIPHISSLMHESHEEVLDDSDVLVFGYRSDEFYEIFKKRGAEKTVIDLARMTESLENIGENYHGICW